MATLQLLTGVTQSATNHQVGGQPQTQGFVPKQPAALIFKSSDTDDLYSTMTASTVDDDGTTIFSNLTTLRSLHTLTSSIAMTNFTVGGHDNDSLRITDALGDEEQSLVPTVLKGIVLITIILLAIFSNLLVVISVVRCHKLRHINNYFLVSLAVADLLVAVFAMTFNATVELTGRWNFGYRICDLWNSLDTHFCTVSTLHLCCIAVDRYYAIVRPLKYTSYMTVKVAACMIGVAWTAPTLISFLPIFFGWYTTAEHQDWRKTHPEECIFRVNQPYAFISSTLTFWAPVFVMLVIYRRIYKEALRQKEAIRRSSVPSQQHLIVDTDSAKSRFQELQANGFRSGPAIKKKKKRKLRDAKVWRKKNDNNDHANGKNVETLPCGIVVAQRLSPTDSEAKPITSSNPKFPVVPILITSSASTEYVRGETLPVITSDDSNDDNQETVALRSGECETKFGGNDLLEDNLENPDNPGGSGDPNILGPFQRMSSLAPNMTPAGFVGTIQRRLSTANSTLSEDASNVYMMSEAFPPLGATGVMGVWTLGLGLLGDRLRERHRIHTSWRKEHKAFVTLGIVMGAFLLCWLPFFTWYLTVAICGDTYCPCPDVVVSILFWIGYFNSTLNPVIYVMTNRDFKDAFTDILRKIFCWCCLNKSCSGGISGPGSDYHSTNVDYV